MEYSRAFFFYIATLKIADALTVLGVWYLAWLLRFHSALFPIPKGVPDFEPYAAVSLPLVLVFSAVFHVVGAYRRDRVHFGFRPLKKLFQGSLLGTLVFIAICYFLNRNQFSRVYLALFPVLVILALVLERGLMQAAWHFVERHLVQKMRLLAVGSGDLLQMYLTKIDLRQPYPLEWVGRLGLPQATGRLGKIPYLGTEERLLRTVRSGEIDGVVLSYPSEDGHRYRDLLEALSNELIAVKVLPDFGRYSTFTYSAAEECGIPLLHFNEAPVGASDRATKRIGDVLGSLLVLILLSPLYLLIAVAVKLTSRGPVFYAQERVGADGNRFILYKFRSMRVGAEATTGAVWAKENDPRTTPLGKFLRRTSLDEFPQFYNVLRGEMSLVGPRPERPIFVDQFREEVPKYMLRHKMKSGITGWAQVNGWRGNTSIEERIKHDLFYIGHWSHRLDLKILLLTLFKGFVNRHAY